MDNESFQNMSNGKSDGLVLFYIKGGKLHPVELTLKQIKRFDIVIRMAFPDGRLSIESQPVKYENIKSLLK